MTINQQKQQWFEHYQNTPKITSRAKDINGLVSAFNVNIDAVIKITGSKIKKIIRDLEVDEAKLLTEGKNLINTPEDALRGLVKCFKNGIAEEWIIQNKETFELLKSQLGSGRLQMGGQGGITANAAAVCGIDPVYVHCASLPKLQSGLFLDYPNLKSFVSENEAETVYKMHRKDDPLLIHNIIEFDKGDTLTLKGKKITCPKANRYIATYDPLNLKLHIDPVFDKAMASGKFDFDYIILSGYQLLQEQLPEGQSGIRRIQESIEVINSWRRNNKNHILHFEMASTQDKAIRKKLVDSFGKVADSIGLNERELIDSMEVIGKEKLAVSCNKNPNSVNLFTALTEFFNYTKVPRIQLHMFGLYMTIQRKGYKISPERNREGMQAAAVAAASKAMTGAIDKPETLSHARNEEVSETGLKELNDLSAFIEAYCCKNDLKETGLYRHQSFDLIAVPSIIVEKPVTLVGMGDTISLLSLIGTGI